MNKHINPVTLKDLTKSNIDGCLPILVEVFNPDLNWGSEDYGQENGYLRLVTDESKVVYKGKTWLPSTFEYTPPDTDGQKIGNASITISSLDARVKMLLRMIKLPSEVKVIATFCKKQKDNSNGFIYKFSELNTRKFEMTVASSTSSTATFNLDYDKSFQQNVPFDIATKDRIPAADED